MTSQLPRMPQDETTHSRVAVPSRSSRDGWEDGVETREVERIPDLETFARIHNIEIGFATFVGTASPWFAYLCRPGKRPFMTQFSRTEPIRPLATDILASIAHEAADIETSIDENEWSARVGLPEDRLPRHSYLTALRQARRLRAWLPVGAYETLLWQITDK